MNFSDNFFRRVEKKTNVDKGTILDLAKKLQETDLKNENTLREIIQNEGCILWHCSGGKDRAGIVAMLVESLLGVSEEDIIADFMASARFQRAKFFWNRVAIYVIPATLRFKRILLVMMAAKPRFLMDAVNEIKEKYGSVVNYCKQELGVTDEDIALMKAKYLE